MYGCRRVDLVCQCLCFDWTVAKLACIWATPRQDQVTTCSVFFGHRLLLGKGWGLSDWVVTVLHHHLGTSSRCFIISLGLFLGQFSGSIFWRRTLTLLSEVSEVRLLFDYFRWWHSGSAGSGDRLLRFGTSSGQLSVLAASPSVLVGRGSCRGLVGWLVRMVALCPIAGTGRCAPRNQQANSLLPPRPQVCAHSALGNRVSPASSTGTGLCSLCTRPSVVTGLGITSIIWG